MDGASPPNPVGQAGMALEAVAPGRPAARHRSNSLDLLYELSKKEIKVRYKSSLLGYLWSLLNPLAMTMVFYLAFRVVLRIHLASDQWPFVLFLICGLFPWQWFANSVSKGSSVYIANASLVRRVNFPRELLVLATVINDMVHFLLSVPVILVMLIAFGGTPSVHLLWGLPALAVVQAMLVYGMALVVASVNVLFRDLTHLIGVILQMWFYLTPVLYDMALVAPARPRVAQFMKLNPMAPLVENYRTLFLEGRISGELLGLAAIHAVVALLVGLWVHSRLKWKFAEVL